MAQTELLKRYLDAGIAFTQLTQQRAEEIVRDLVRVGEVQTEDARRWVETLIARNVSRPPTEDELAEMVRVEVQRQLADLAPLTQPAAKQPAAKKVAAKKAAAKKPAVMAVPVAKSVKRAKPV